MPRPKSEKEQFEDRLLAVTMERQKLEAQMEKVLAKVGDNVIGLPLNKEDGRGVFRQEYEELRQKWETLRALEDEMQATKDAS